MGNEKAKFVRRLLCCLSPLAVCLSLGCADGRLFDRDRNDRPDPLTGLSQVPPDRRNVSVTSNPGDGASGLAMRDRTTPDPYRDRTVQPTGWTGNHTDSDAAKLGSPTTGGPTGTRSSPATFMNTGRIRSFEEAQQLLVARGVKVQELHQRDGEWYFTCSVPIPNKPNSTKTYEATDRYGLLAIQKVIDKMKADGN